ncbi:MAG: class D beta-lactamase [Legionellaceae bacterium]|nr:class D beta-lactamase [Legionellaceae bacterium]
MTFTQRLVLSCLFFSLPVFANNDCFITKDTSGAVLAKFGACSLRHSPCSTFKIAISLMGYDNGFLIDEAHPELPFEDGYVDWLEIWKQPHTPKTWMQHSCVWYSQCITKHLGLLQFKKYIHALNYGNQDVLGDEGQNNGLTNAWLSSSLQISPEEQITLLEKLLSSQLPVSIQAQAYTRNIMYLKTLPNGWKLFGKTGNGYKQLTDNKLDKTRQIGWFIGWVEKNEQTLIFTQYIEDEKAETNYASLRAKNMAIDKIIKLTQNLPEKLKHA